ncbi:MAG: hypothetical protein K1000chlam2_01756 [Chlamydiae bacterium]|nr:hypothetical protein [Chlamydiota bacterium]
MKTKNCRQKISAIYEFISCDWYKIRFGKAIAAQDAQRRLFTYGFDIFEENIDETFCGICVSKYHKNPLNNLKQCRRAISSELLY